MELRGLSTTPSNQCHRHPPAFLVQTACDGGVIGRFDDNQLCRRQTCSECQCTGPHQNAALNHALLLGGDLVEAVTWGGVRLQLWDAMPLSDSICHKLGLRCTHILQRCASCSVVGSACCERRGAGLSLNVAGHTSENQHCSRATTCSGSAVCRLLWSLERKPQTAMSSAACPCARLRWTPTALSVASVPHLRIRCR